MYYFKNFFLFTLIALLVVQCQKDDENTDVESEQSKKEFSREQEKVLKKYISSLSLSEKKEKAKLIFNSEENQNSDKSNFFFINKIDDDAFFENTEKMVFKDGTFNRNNIKERLSKTSFKSVDEFIDAFNNMVNNNKKLFNKYPEYKFLLDEIIEEQKLSFIEEQKLSFIKDKKKKMIRQSNCDCRWDYNNCSYNAGTKFRFDTDVCLMYEYSNISYTVCILLASRDFEKAEKECKEQKEYCEEYCLWHPGDDMKAPSN